MTRFRQLLLACLLVGASCTFGDGRDPVDPSSREALSSRQLIRMACGLPRRQLRMIWNGFHPERSGQIQFVPAEPNYMGNYLSHSGPWSYLQRVPMLWYGPGQVPARGRVDRAVTMADVAPTIASLIGFPFAARDGEPMREAIGHRPARKPPRLVLVVVWDGGGRNVLATHPDQWPNLRSFISEGAWYENAVVGSSPSHTAPIHATLGTGAFPSGHGRVDGVFRVGDRTVRPESYGPRDLLVPSLADLYDRKNGNRPLVGVVGATPWHLGMAGQGAGFEGGDRDFAVLQIKQDWGLTRNDSQHFQAPPYATDMSAYEEVGAEIDREDGVIDGSWHGDRFKDGANVLKKFTTIRWQTRILEQLVDREGFGKDAVTDLMFVNYKQVDAVGHEPGMNSPDMGAVVHRVDSVLAELGELLDRAAGRGRWAMVVTADHGSTPEPSVSGAFPISVPEFSEDFKAAFDDDGDDRPLVPITRITQLWVDPQEMRENGVTLEQISGWISRYTVGDNLQDPSSVSPQRARERLFAAAFPSSLLGDLPCLRAGTSS